MPKVPDFESSKCCKEDEDAETLAAIQEGIRDAKAGRAFPNKEVGEMLDSRYDDIKSGRIAPIPGEHVLSQLRHKNKDKK